jgi:signal transduction histidine kinase
VTPRWVRAAARLVAQVALGAVTAVAGLAFAAAYPLGPRFVAAGARRLTRIECRRLGMDDVRDRGTRRAVAYLAVRSPIGLLGGVVLFLLAYGAVTTAAAAMAWAGGGRPDGIAPTVPIIVYLLTAGVVLLFLDLAGLFAVLATERAIARRLLGPDARELMRSRIAELSASRAGIVEAVDAERRRIERDLHDGLQQRLVALAMLLGRARRSGADELYRQAHDEAQRAVEELRDVAWRVYPAALDELGLAEALATVAERAPIPVRIRCDLPMRPPPRIETAAYFAVRESVTNAAKHAGAILVDVSISAPDATVVIRITDDGTGGADPQGSGLTGLARRIAALDGRFTITSPPGGPTAVEVTLPCV